MTVRLTVITIQGVGGLNDPLTPLACRWRGERVNINLTKDSPWYKEGVLQSEMFLDRLRFWVRRLTKDLVGHL